jgi:hypothetical protein
MCQSENPTNLDWLGCRRQRTEDVVLGMGRDKVGRGVRSEVDGGSCGRCEAGEAGVAVTSRGRSRAGQWSRAGDGFDRGSGGGGCDDAEQRQQSRARMRRAVGTQR